MSDTTGVNQRPKATPPKVESPRTAGIAAASEAPAPSPERIPNPDLASEVALQEHIDALGPGFVRTPFGQRQARLSAQKREGFHRHWVNDVPGRVKMFQEAGWKVVHEKGQPLNDLVVGINARGEGQKAVLMEIPLQWYLEDMAARQRAADEIEQTIRRNEVAATDGSHRYTPKEGIEVRVEKLGSPLAPRVSS